MLLFQDATPPDPTPTQTPTETAAEAAVQAANPLAESAGAASQAASGVFDGLRSGDTNAVVQATHELVTASVPILLNILGGLIIVVLAFVAAAWIAKAVRGTTRKAKVDPTLASFFGQIAYWAIIIIGLIAAVGRVGIPIASFVAVLGGLSLAIGLAFQGSLGNVASGVMLLLFRPMRVGEVVKVQDMTLKVNEIGLFATTFDTFDNRRIIIPNGNIFGSTIENISHHKTRRMDINVGTAYGADIDETRKVLAGVTERLEGKLTEPAPQVYLSDMGESSINWAVRVWANADVFWGVREQLVRDIKVALDDAGIGIPFPQMDVHLDGIIESEIERKSDKASD